MNSAIGDTLPDGATIDKEFEKIFTDEEVNCISLQEY